MHDSDEMARDALEAGARGYLMKSDAGRELVHAVEAVSLHRPYFTSRFTEKLVRVFLGHEPPRDGSQPAVDLTPREREILRFLAEGKTSKEVAALCGISTKTAETHRARIMRKLQLKGPADLIRYAIRHRLTQS
jgi:DNA-binding NarL/FixJ family response regulator